MDNLEAMATLETLAKMLLLVNNTVVNASNAHLVLLAQLEALANPVEMVNPEMLENLDKVADKVHLDLLDLLVTLVLLAKMDNPVDLVNLVQLALVELENLDLKVHLDNLEAMAILVDPDNLVGPERPVPLDHPVLLDNPVNLVVMDNPEDLVKMVNLVEMLLTVLVHQGLLVWETLEHMMEQRVVEQLEVVVLLQ